MLVRHCFLGFWQFAKGCASDVYGNAPSINVCKAKDVSVTVCKMMIKEGPFEQISLAEET